MFVVGDTAHLEQNGKPLPGVAQVAMQQGRYVGKLISSRLAGRPPTSAFSYFDKGNMAVIGKNFGILESGKLRLSGFPAWVAWACIHLAYLPQAQHRGEVLLQWAWAYMTGQQGSRLILDPVSPPPVSAPALSQERIA
jgi:NADH dehydrogenase